MSTYPIKFSDLEKENKRLRDAIRNIPTDEYGEAQRDGCGPSGAWDCFLGYLQEWEKQTLKGE